jgi:hypothetical protein
LPVTVDLQADALITYPPLKAHIDAVMRPLFERQEHEIPKVASMMLRA